MIYAAMGPQVQAAGRGKLTFPKLIKDPVCHAAAIPKGPFLKFFRKTKETKLRFNGRKSSVRAGIFPTGERAQKTCIRMSDGHKIGSSSITSY